MMKAGSRARHEDPATATLLHPATAVETLGDLRRAEAECRSCPLYQFATQVVPGEGDADPSLMLVGEQPGDREDLAGKPFVGPAGHILDRALAAAGIDRSRVFVTNAVKHFKYEQRGKRRLHKRPNAGEIEACRWWLDLERTLVKPASIVALGATAVRSLLRRSATIAETRGRPHVLADGTPVFVTIHPSLLLRMPDEAAKAAEYRHFVEDLRAAGEAAGH
jgi:DNA polymerase